MNRLLVALLCSMALPVRAELTIAARGSATIAAGDTATARGRALDDAVRQAVDQVIGQLVDAKGREAAADIIKKRVLRRATAYVAHYKIVEEGPDDTVYAVHVDATVNDTQLAADLRALGVGGAPAKPAPSAPPVVAKRPGLALLLITSDGTNSWATFGRAGAPGPVATALERELRARGFDVVSTAGLEVPVAAGGELPLDSTQAQALARTAGAGSAVVGTARLHDGGRIRGTALVGSEVELSLRLDDSASASKVLEVRIEGAGFGADVAAAEGGAGRSAASHAGRALAVRLDRHWPATGIANVGDGVAVQVRGATRWADVDAVIHSLAAVPGVETIRPARFARREVTIVARGSVGVRALAEAASQLTLPERRIVARASGSAVAIELSPDASAPPPIEGR